MFRTFLVATIALTLFSFGISGVSYAAEIPQQQAEVDVPQSVYDYIENDQLRIQTARENLLRAWSTTRALFSPQAITFSAKNSNEHWRIKFALEKISGAPVETIAPKADENVVTYDRGVVREEYVNRADGIEQRFVILNSDAVTAQGLTLEGDLATPLRATHIPGQGVVFSSRGVDRFVYGEPVAFDANGNDIPVSFDLVDGEMVRFTLAASDLASALFPVTIDPILTTVANTIDPTDQAGAMFGKGVSTAGDVNGDGYSDVIVGAHLYDGVHTDEGRAYVFFGSSTGLNTSSPHILGPAAGHAQAGMQFGFRVSTAGDVNADGYWDVVVSSPYWDSVAVDSGSVSVFHGSSSGISSWPDEGGVRRPYLDLYNPDANVSALYGVGLGYAGDVNGDGYSDIIIAAPGYTGDAINEGRAYAFYGSSTGLAAFSSWNVDPTNQAGAQFGLSASTAGDVNGDGYSDVVVGAWMFDNGATDNGAAFVFLGSMSGLSTSMHATLSPTSQAYANFGISVSTAGDVNGDGLSDVIAGAPYVDGAYSAEGRAYIFQGVASGLSASPTSVLTAAIVSSRGSQNFGWSVGTAGDVNGDGYGDVIVGAPWDGTALAPVDEVGAAFVFYGTSSGVATLGYTALPAASGNATGNEYGGSVFTAGDVNGDGYSDVIIGAKGFDAQATDEGRAYVYHGSMNGVSTTASQTVDPTNQAQARFGNSVADAGDVNGDGYGDVIVGAPWYDSLFTDQGRAYIFVGSTNGFSTGIPWAEWSPPTMQAGAQFGWSVAGAGDTNADGYDDVIIGAPYYDQITTSTTYTDAGYAHVYSGASLSPTGGAPQSQTVLYNSTTNANFGWSVASAGDVNGDDYLDVIVGAPGFTANSIQTGRAFVYHGSSSGLSNTSSWQLAVNASALISGNFGYSVASAGDVNRDGYSDIIVGNPLDDYDAATNRGSAYIFYGSSSGISTSGLSAILRPMTASGDQAGFSVASAGDVNGDGYSDVMVGAPYADGSFADVGKVYVYHGSSIGVTNELVPASTITYTASESIHFGEALAPAGDVNGDGYADIVVGAPDYDGGSGLVALHLGSATGIQPAYTSVILGPTGEFFGQSVAAADVNGDGFRDIVVGAVGNDANATDEGRISVFHANGSGRSGTPLRIFSYTISTNTYIPFSRGRRITTLISNLLFSYLHLTIPLVKGGGCHMGMEYEIVNVGSAFTGSSTIGDSFGSLGPITTCGTGENVLLALPPSSGTGYKTRVRYKYPSMLISDVSLRNTSGLYLGGQVSRWYDLFSNGQEADFYPTLSVSAPTSLAQTYYPYSGMELLLKAGMSVESLSTLGAQIRLSSLATAVSGAQLYAQYEVKAVGTDFDGLNLFQSPSSISGTPAGVVISLKSTAVYAPGSYHWRARIRNRSTGGASDWVSFGSNAETAADFTVTAATALSVSNVSASVLGRNSARVTWASSVAGQSWLYYRKQGASDLSLIINLNSTASHSVTLMGLSPGTTYEYIAMTKSGGSSADGGTQTFTTASLPTATLSISGISISSISSDGATVSWATNYNADSNIFYRKQETPTFYLTNNTATRTSHSLGLSGLTADTTYEYFVGGTAVVPLSLLSRVSRPLASLFVPFAFAQTEETVAATGMSATGTFTTASPGQGGGTGPSTGGGGPSVGGGAPPTPGDVPSEPGVGVIDEPAPGEPEEPVSSLPLRQIEEIVSEEPPIHAAPPDEPPYAAIIRFTPADSDSDVVRAVANGARIVNDFVDDPVADTNGNGVRDDWEKKYGVVVRTGHQDCDADGLSDAVEYRIGTDPCNADTDGDGYTDAEEFLNYGMNPLVADGEIPLGKIAVMNMYDGMTTADPTPLIIGYGVTPGHTVRAYVANVFGESLLFGTGDVEPSRKFFINPDVPLLDGRYDLSLVEFDTSDRVAEAETIDFGIDTSLTITPPTPESLSGLVVKPDVLKRKEALTVGEKRPSLKGRTNVGDIIFANWKSLLLSSALLADTTLGTFETRPSSSLDDGEHELFVYALREEDLARSPDVNLLFKVVGGEVVAIRKAPPISAPWLIVIAVGLAVVMLLVLVVRRKKKEGDADDAGSQSASDSFVDQGPTVSSEEGVLPSETDAEAPQEPKEDGE